LFDNGNQHTPNYSRAVEYKLDEQNKTADLVWEYRHNPDIYNAAMGSVERLPNGNTLIGWGLAGFLGSPAFTEVHPDNSVALEMKLPINQGSYRVYKFPWVSQTPAASVSLEVIQGNTYNFDGPNDTTGITMTFNQLTSSLYANTTIKRYTYAPVNPTFTSTAPIMAASYFNIQGSGISSYTGLVKVNLSYYPDVTNPKGTTIYTRLNSDSNFVPLATSYDSTTNELSFTASTFGDFAFGTSYLTTLSGSNNVVTTYTLHQNYPNPFNPSTTIEFSIPNSQFVTLKIYDILGRLVKTLVNGEKLPGNYMITFNATDLSSGIYFYRLQAGGFIQSKKMILLK
jgi:Arylsulfotransferase (ASST)/Secretion system C-terminal sorting domain